MFRIAAISLVFLSSLMISHQAGAQPGQCETGSPGSDSCTQVAESAPPPGSLAVPESPRREATHDFFLPNGTLTAPGKLSLSIHEFGMMNTFAFGVTEWLELSASAPLFPIIASIGARVSLTPRRSPFRLLVGVSMWSTLVDDGDDNRPVGVQPTGTIGYRGDRFEVHATLSGLYHDDDWMLPAGNIGISTQIGRRYRFHLNYASLNVDNIDWTDGENPRINVILAGLKFSKRRWDVDFGLMVPVILPDNDDERVPLPFISFRYLHE